MSATCSRRPFSVPAMTRIDHPMIRISRTVSARSREVTSSSARRRRVLLAGSATASACACSIARGRARDRRSGASASPTGACRRNRRAAQLQIAFGDLESVVRLRQRLQPRPAPARNRILVEQDAVRLVAAAADAAAQLMELRQAEPLGVLDDHHGGIRHVDADFDDGRRHEKLDLARRERPHHAILARPVSCGRAAAPRGTAGNTSCAR